MHRLRCRTGGKNKDVAVQIGASWSEQPMLQSERYGLLKRPDLPDLPALLAVYLEAYAGRVL